MSRIGDLTHKTTSLGRSAKQTTKKHPIRHLNTGVKEGLKKNQTWRTLDVSGHKTVYIMLDFDNTIHIIYDSKFPKEDWLAHLAWYENGEWHEIEEA